MNTLTIDFLPSIIALVLETIYLNLAISLKWCKDLIQWSFSLWDLDSTGRFRTNAKICQCLSLTENWFKFCFYMNLLMGMKTRTNWAICLFELLYVFKRHIDLLLIHTLSAIVWVNILNKKDELKFLMGKRERLKKNSVGVGRKYSQAKF